MIGIYKIINNLNGHCYIGQSINIEKRLKEHINEAFNEKRREYNYPLSRAYRKYGIENFSTEILEQCPKEELGEKEKYYIQYYNSKTYGYNQTDGGEQHFITGENHYKAKLTDEEVYYIREEYNNHTPKIEVYNLFKSKISLSGFTKIWLGYSRKNVHMDVYTEENKKYWEYLKNISGNRLYTDEEIVDIRTRLKNGEPKESIYKDYKGKTSHSSESFNDICSGKRYTHIQV